jgi:hypothetical protein
MTHFKIEVQKTLSKSIIDSTTKTEDLAVNKTVTLYPIKNTDNELDNLFIFSPNQMRAFIKTLTKALVELEEPLYDPD